MEKNEDADQKIEQDGTPNKPEDKAHKAATKIQASFRGHITRKKMKDGEEEKEGDSPAAEEAADGEETKKVEGEEAPAKQEETAGEEAKKEGEETNQAKTPGADKPANSPAGTASSPVAAAPAAASPTAPSEAQKEEPKAEEKPKEVEATAKSPTTATAEEKKEEEKREEKREEARKADVPAAVSPTAEKEEPNQTNDKKGMQIKAELHLDGNFLRLSNWAHLCTYLYDGIRFRDKTSSHFQKYRSNYSLCKNLKGGVRQAAWQTPQDITAC